MKKHQLVQKIKTHIEEHLEDELSLDAIANDLHYSKFYLARVFSDETGTTIYKHIQNQRLSQAAAQLVGTQQRIIDIAADAGYSSSQAFTLAFRHKYLCTPQHYRSQKQQASNAECSMAWRTAA